MLFASANVLTGHLICKAWEAHSPHAHHFTATGLSGNSRPRRLKIAEPSGCKSRVADRRVVNREQQTGSTQDRTALGVQVSPRRPIWNVNRTSGPGLGANECVPSGKWCESTAFRHSCARSSKRAGGLIPRIALDQCRVPERYRTRVPFSIGRMMKANEALICGTCARAWSLF